MDQQQYKKNFMAPFYGWGSTASGLQPLQGGSLLFTIQFPEICCIYSFYHPRKDKMLSQPWKYLHALAMLFHIEGIKYFKKGQFQGCLRLFFYHLTNITSTH